MGAGSSLDEAAAQALQEMHRLVQDHMGLDPLDAAMLISLVGDVHVAQLVNPLKSVKVKVPSAYLSLP